MSEPDGSRVRPGARRADPLYAADPRLLSGARLRRALSLGALRRGAVSAAGKAARRVPGGVDHDGGARTSRARATRGPGAPYNAAAKFYRVYSGRHRASTTICGSPMSRSTGRTRPPRTATPGFRCRSCGAARRRAGSARSRRVSTGRRPTAAIARRSNGTARSCWRAAAPIALTPPFSSPIDRCATRP